jgi:hypothetical protein
MIRANIIFIHIMLTSILGIGKSFGYISSSLSKTTSSTIRKMSHQITLPEYGTPTFGISRKLPGTSFEKAVEDTKAALKKSGFGVITEIDMRATCKRNNHYLCNYTTTLDSNRQICIPCQSKTNWIRILSLM